MEPTVKVLVEIPTSSRALTREGVSQRTGKPYKFAVQDCFAFVGGQYPERMEIMLNNAADAYAPGRYIASKLKATQRGVLLDLSELTPVPVSAARSA